MFKLLLTLAANTLNIISVNNNSKNMSKTWIIVIALAAVALITGAVLLATGISIYNTQASLKNAYEMKVKSNEAEFDNMWKKIQQSTQIADAKKDGFRQIFTEYAKGRTAEGQGRMMTWVKETIPNVNLNIYNKVLNIMTGSRDSWTFRQNEAVDIARQYNQNLVTFPKNMLLHLFGFEKIDPKIVTSSRTEQAFSTGKDDDMNLFKK